ncbi:hypothetical protein [Micromonospora sp. DT227]|uniref:hypothetical protein n=1 Tax=Micromonospora sp. DT227 TaxID=3393433 RepID=UPI003CFB42A3
MPDDGLVLTSEEQPALAGEQHPATPTYTGGPTAAARVLAIRAGRGAHSSSPLLGELIRSGQTAVLAHSVPLATTVMVKSR